MKIIAPHPDDEVIGCFGILKEKPFGDICVIFLEVDVQRKKEAEKSARLLKFQAEFGLKHYDWVDEEVFVPDPFTERHPLHREEG